jgi:hypothetical protein
MSAMFHPARSGICTISHRGEKLITQSKDDQRRCVIVDFLNSPLPITRLNVLHLLDHQKSLLTAFLDYLLDRFVLHSIGQAVEV